MRIVILLALCAAGFAPPASADDRPNILWIVSEDNGPFLGCYGDPLATTPSIDALAASGVRYRNAFANAPVCAPARSILATGVYAPAMGTEHMRSKNRVPASIRYLSQYLRDAGYFCTNNAKTDYNMAPSKDVWDESSRKAHYRHRRHPEQPFFAVFNIGLSHESSLHNVRTPRHDPARVQLPPYHPDVPEIRKDWAWYYDKVEAMDTRVGKLLDELRKEGLWDDTIVFYYSDHGGAVTRSKRFLYDSGTRVPLIVRLPARFASLVGSEPGTATDELVSFIDLPPTVLRLAGVEISEHMSGRPFLGEGVSVADGYTVVPLFRGRMDERYDLMRGVRTKRFKYIRNFEPTRIYGQHLEYLWRMQTTRTWKSLFDAGKCDAAQRRFWETKPTEELYDIANDPHEVRNLAADPSHEETLEELRRATFAWILKCRDSGFMPEGMMLERSDGATIYEYVRSPSYPLAEILDAADHATREKNVVPEASFAARLGAGDGAVRYWAAVAVARHVDEESVTAEVLEGLLALRADPFGDVRVAAAEALWRLGRRDEADAVLRKTLTDGKVIDSIVLRAVNVCQVLKIVSLRDAVAQARERGNYVARAADWFLESVKE